MRGCLLRTGLVPAILSAGTDVVAGLVSSPVPAGESSKLLAVVLPAAVASVAVGGVTVLG